VGFSSFNTGYDWSRVQRYRDIATQHGGVLDFSVGSPIDPVPDSVRLALSEASTKSNAHGYPATAGSRDLREAILHWFQNERDVDFTSIAADVVPTVGSKEAVALMASLLHCGDGDVIVQPRVSYPTYEIGTQLAGAKVLKVDEVSDVESWVHEPNVKAVWVNSPSNPTGEVLESAQLRSIVRAARSIGAIVLADECYARMDWRGAAKGSQLGATPCILDDEVCEGGAEGLLCLYSLSKQSNMAGYRTALIAGDAQLVAAMLRYRKQIGLIIPGPVQAAMAAGLKDVEGVRAQVERYRKRLHILAQALSDYGYDARMPQGGLYIWVRALSDDCWQDMQHLAELGIVPSPGEFYGDSRYLRFSTTASDESIATAAGRLSSNRA
jgi:succinyldiaminopimelate transaminase